MLKINGTPIHIKTKDNLLKLISLDETTESLYLDFKREINLSNKEKLSEEIACDICQFINTNGGCLVIGIAEEKNEYGIKVAKEFNPVKNYEDISQFINDIVHELIFPKRQLFEIVPINYSESNIVVIINVMPTQNSLFCVRSKKSHRYFQFPYRTNYGKKYYTYDELELRMHSQNREKFIRASTIWDRSKEVNLLSPIIKKELSQEKLWDHRDYTIFINEIFENEIQLLVNDRTINIPFGLVRDIWNAEDNKIGLIIDAEIIDPEDRSKFVLKL